MNEASAITEWVVVAVSVVTMFAAGFMYLVNHFQRLARLEEKLEALKDGLEAQKEAYDNRLDNLMRSMDRLSLQVRSSELGWERRLGK